MSAQTQPGVSCDAEYRTPGEHRNAAVGLLPKRADDAGRVSWSWPISASTKPGIGSVSVTCDGQTATASIRIG